MIFRVIIDHGLGHDLIVRVSSGVCQMSVHESGNLVHVQVNIWNIRRWNGGHLQQGMQPVICIFIQKIASIYSNVFLLINAMGHIPVIADSAGT